MMHVTKYEHACLVVQKGAQSIIIDPGEFTGDLTIPDDVAAIIITHEHPDHFSMELLEEIIDDNPHAIILGPAQVTRQLSSFETRTVKGGDSFTLGDFDLDFYGDDHAIIHRTKPHVENVGVLIEDRLFYPGDALVVPEKSVDTLALPISAPWLKVGEIIDYINVVSPRLIFPTHDAILSITGKHLLDRIVSEAADEHGMLYQRIDEQTIEIE